MAKIVDLNCDMGEGCGNDAELMRYVSSANIACGYHAGDEDTMRRTVHLALKNNVAIGAHPGYKDRENFGRNPQDISLKEAADIVTEQITILKNISDQAGAVISHVKPHGALYNQSAQDLKLAAAIAQAVYDFDPKLILFGLSGSVSISEAKKIGLKTASEVFADRTYQNDGSLTPRTRDDALIDNVDSAALQALKMVSDGVVNSTDGKIFELTADTICIHGDGPHAVEFAKAIRDKLLESQIEIRPI